MKKIISWVIVMTMLFTMAGSVASVYADDGIDNTPPALKSVKVLNGENLNASEDSVSILINVKEDGSGMTDIWFTFANKDGSGCLEWSAYDYDETFKGELLFTGEYTIEVPIMNKLAVGDYYLSSVYMKDANGNEINQFYDLEGSDSVTAQMTKLSVTSSNYKDEQIAKFTYFEILETENLDASGELKIRFILDSPGYIDQMSFDFMDVERNVYVGDTIYWRCEGYLWEGLTAGEHTLSIPINNRLPVGKMTLAGINLGGGNDSGVINGYHFTINEESSGVFHNIDINVAKSAINEMPIELADLTFEKTEIQAPDVLKVNLKLKENGHCVEGAHFWFMTEKSKEVSYETKCVVKNDDGSYTAKLLISPFVAEGRLELSSMRVYADDMDHIEFFFRENQPLLEKSINIDSGYNITYFGALGNKAVVDVLKKMNPGETAVLDCRVYKTVPESLFQTIAGRDVTLALIDEDVQWVFNGLDIKKEKCKDINVKSTIKVVNGASYGFANDSKVALMVFKDNGELPGEVEMRINYDYLAEKYAFKKENMRVTYLDENLNAFEEDSDVDVAEDEYYEYEVDHNSTFALSKNKAKLGKVKVTAVPNGLKAIKIKWGKKPGNGYYVYRSTKKNTGYKKIATIKNRDTVTYTDKKIKHGKVYYYKVKPYSKDKSFNKTAVNSVACKAVTQLKNPKIYVCKQPKGKKQVNVHWEGSSDEKHYVVYRSIAKNGKYYKVKTTTRCHFYDKNVKRGKTYFYKVKAIHKSAKHNSNFSEIKSIKVK